MENLSLYFAKFLITGYTSILAPLLPMLMLEMKLSLTQAGGLVSLFSLFNSLLQPVFGWAQDRVGWRPFLVIAPLWVGAWMGLMGVAPGFGALAGFIFLAGIGICAFHPASFAAAGRAGRGRDGEPGRRATVISLLLLASSLGFVAGPAFISGFAANFGIGRLYWICIPGIAATLILCRAIPKRVEPEAGRKAVGAAPFRAVASPVLPFFLAALSISIAAMNLYSFIPILFKGLGVSMETAGLCLSSFALGSAAGPLIGSTAARRFGRFPTVLSASVLSALFLAVFMRTVMQAGPDGPPAFAVAALTGLGIALMLPFSILIDMAQEKAPRHVGAVSSLLGGFAWGCGGVLVILFARAAERFGVESVLSALLLFPAFNFVLALAARSFREG